MEPNRYVWLPASAYEAMKELHSRIIAYELEPEQAHAKMEAILAPHLDRPILPTDRVEIVRKEPVVYSHEGNH